MADLLWQQANQQYLNQAIAPLRQALTDYIAGEPHQPAALPEPADIDPVLGLQPPALSKTVRSLHPFRRGTRYPAAVPRHGTGSAV
jgi:hypothetical protein